MNQLEFFEFVQAVGRVFQLTHDEEGSRNQSVFHELTSNVEQQRFGGPQPAKEPLATFKRAKETEAGPAPAPG